MSVAEVVRWSLEVVFLVVMCFALGAVAMALVLRALLPPAPEPSEVPEPGLAPGRPS